MSFYSELKRRNIFRVVVLYVITSWVILQAADVLSDILPVPVWTGSLVFLLLVLALPLVIAFSWIYEITPEGIKLEKDIRREESIVRNTGRRIEVLIGVIAVVAIVVVVIDRLVPERGATGEPPAETMAHRDLSPEPEVASSIAVLPFVDMSEAGDQSYFSDGLAEELLNLLAQMPELKVAARTSSFSFRDKSFDVPTIAERLGVRYVLEGSVRKYGDRLRITAQLIDANTNFHTWSETFERRQDDIFLIQDEIARQVVEALKLRLSEQSEDILARQATFDIQAFEAYLQGRSYLRRPASDTTLAAAEAKFAEAIEIDPQYADAHAGLCDTHLERYEHNREIASFEDAERACNRALTLSSDEAPVLVALGRLYALSGQGSRAEQNFQRAIAIDAQAADAYEGLARTYERQNRMDLAQANFQKAIDTEPGYWHGYMAMGSFFFRAGRNEEAHKYTSKAVELLPNNPRSLNNLGTVLYMQGDFEEARQVWYRSLQIEPTPIAYSNLGTASFFLRDFEQAAAMYTRAVELTPEDHEPWGALGDAYRRIDGREDLAAASYGQAIGLAEQYVELNPEDAYVQALLAHYLASSGRAAEAAVHLNRATEFAPGNMYVHYFAALVAATSGDVDGAISAARRAVESGYPPQFLLVDAGLDSINDRPEIRALAQRRLRGATEPDSSRRRK